MRLLVIVHVDTDDEELERFVERSVDRVGLRILPYLVVSWRDRATVERELYRIKNRAASRMERLGVRAVLETAVLQLTDEQYNSMRHIVRRRVDEAAGAMLGEARRLLGMVRGARSQRTLVERYRRLARDVERLANAALALDVRSPVMDELIKVMEEVRIEIRRVARR